jgi:hypothetical protein
MPPGRRPIPSEDERRIAEKEARFRALVEAGLTKTNVPGPGFLESIGRAMFNPVIDEYIQSLQPLADANIRKEGTRARINAVQQPIDYYTALPDLKAAVLADMAMGIQRSADAEEGIREQRMANAPSVFPTEWANRQDSYRLENITYDDNPSDYINVVPYETTGANELPRFVIGQIDQSTIRNRMPDVGQQSINTSNNFMDPVLRQLKPGQAIIVTNKDSGSNDDVTNALASIFGSRSQDYVTPQYMIVAKDENGRLYQREIDQPTYNNIVESMRSGYPMGPSEQLLIDEIASRSMMPRVRQDEVFNLYTPAARVKQLTYVSPETMDSGVGNAAGFVATDIEPRGMTLASDYMPRVDMIQRALMELGLSFGDEQKMEDVGQYVLIHEQGHTWDKQSPLDSRISDTTEYENAAKADARINSKYRNNFIPNTALFEEGRNSGILFGSTFVTPYGERSYDKFGYSEDFAERQALWQFSKLNNGLGTTKDGEIVTFEDLFPNSARFLEKVMKARYGK